MGGGRLAFALRARANRPSLSSFSLRPSNGGLVRARPFGGGGA